MKSAIEWREAIYQSDMVELDLEMVELIQCDARRQGLLDAAQVCRDIAAQDGNCSNAVRSCARAIEAEADADKLKEGK